MIVIRTSLTNTQGLQYDSQIVSVNYFSAKLKTKACLEITGIMKIVRNLQHLQKT